MTAKNDARAFWVAAPGRGEIRETTLGPLAPDHARLRAIASGVSRGTESLVFRGLVPESERQRMRAPLQEGEFPAPVKYGYQMVARVVAGPADLIGREVFALAPHQTLFDAPRALLRPLPEGLAPQRAVMAANMETAVNALWDAAPRVGDRIAVIGAGVVGLLTASLAARTVGASVEVVDVDPGKAAVAARLGLRLVAPEAARGECDLVYHASGAPAGLNTALTLAGFEATVVEMSWYGDQTAPLRLGEAFHARRLTLRSSQVGHVAPARRARRDHAARLDLALRLVRDDDRLDALITGASPFDDLPTIMPRLAGADHGGALLHRVDYA